MNQLVKAMTKPPTDQTEVESQKSESDDKQEDGRDKEKETNECFDGYGFYPSHQPITKIQLRRIR